MMYMPPKAQFTRNRSGKRTATARQSLEKTLESAVVTIATEGAAARWSNSAP